jgi:hypothetical protein
MGWVFLSFAFGLVAEALALADRSAPSFGFGFVRLQEIIHLLFGRFLGETVALLDSPDELLALACNLLEIVIRQFAPSLANASFDLLPLAFELFPIHFRHLAFFRRPGSSDPRRCSLYVLCATYTQARTRGSKPRSILKVISILGFAEESA